MPVLDIIPAGTAQACELRDSWGELQSKVELFGISGDSVESHQKFIKKHGLPFPLLSDPNHEIVQAYQIWAEKSMHGKKYMGTERTTYLIGPDRRIKAILEKVKPAEHVTQLAQGTCSVGSGLVDDQNRTRAIFQRSTCAKQSVKWIAKGQ
jgi:thioredoxin-dependent peroxiredoxin